MTQKKIIKKIKELKKQKNAVLLVHNYQRPEIQDIADYLGDSLNLSRIAADVDCDMIVFCGVSFMAETAKILSPDKKVLIPRKDAACPMADMITESELIKLQKANPQAKTVAYVNTNAAIKALADVCCTSANALNIVKNIDADKVIFVPDKNLGSYVRRFTDKEIILWQGHCYVHNSVRPEELRIAKEQHPDALLMVHPECPPEAIDIADEVLSTEGMVRLVQKSPARKIIVGTEQGIIHRLKKYAPDKIYYSVGSSWICKTMKLTRLEDVLSVLEKEDFEIKLSNDIIERSRKSLEKMIECS